MKADIAFKKKKKSKAGVVEDALELQVNKGGEISFVICGGSKDSWRAVTGPLY